MGRTPCCDKANVKRGPWSPEEDARLKAYIEKHGTGGNWIALPPKISLKRCGKSCRLRWLNYLRPDIRHGGFSEEEDQIICSLYISIGSRWSIIAAQLPGRTDNDIKNYWNTRLKKKLLGCRRDPSQSRRSLGHCQESSSEHNRSYQDASSQTLSSVALERMQLHLELQGLQNQFPFYSNPASMWHNLHPLVNNRLLQSQLQIDATVVANPIHTEHAPAALVSSYRYSWNPVELDTANYASMSTSTLEEHFHRSNLKFVEDWLQADNLQLDQLDFYPGMASGKKKNVNLWGSDTYNEKSPSSSWDSVSDLQPDSMLQDYVLDYDL